MVDLGEDEGRERGGVGGGRGGMFGEDGSVVGNACAEDRKSVVVCVGREERH